MLQAEYASDHVIDRMLTTAKILVLGPTGLCLHFNQGSQPHHSVTQASEALLEHTSNR